MWCIDGCRNYGWFFILFRNLELKSGGTSVPWYFLAPKINGWWCDDGTRVPPGYLVRTLPCLVTTYHFAFLDKAAWPKKKANSEQLFGSYALSWTMDVISALLEAEQRESKWYQLKFAITDWTQNNTFCYDQNFSNCSFWEFSLLLVKHVA